MNGNGPTTFDPSGSILFLGSGFAAEARNLSGDLLPTGMGLKQIFADLVGVEVGAYDLQTLADEVATRTDLYQLLYQTFTVVSLSEMQLRLLSLPWLRIYTTNYDDAIELGLQKQHKAIHSYCYDESKPRKLLPGSVVHLHGAIRRTSSNNVRDQLVLNEHSYVRQHFERSLWYDEFSRDVRFATNCCFIGYRLADYHIAALLQPVKTIRDKTFFIVKEHDQIFANRVAEYGRVMPIGLDGFVKLYLELPKLNRLQSPHSLKTFRYIDPLRDKKTITPPTPIEILNLVTYGTFNEGRCMETLPNSRYVISRQEMAESAVKTLVTGKTLLVHSRLGNGKSIFLSILAHKLAAAGHQCFWCHENSPTLLEDLRALKPLQRLVIFFDSYDVAIEVLDSIAQELDDAVFVVAIRTGILEIRAHEILDRLPQPIGRVSLDGLADSERDDFLSLLDLAGILERGLRTDVERCDDIREIVTSIYKHSGIREKLENELVPIFSDTPLRRIVIATHLLKIAGQDAESAFLRAVSGFDPFTVAQKFRTKVSEIIRIEDGELRAHSPVFSAYLSEEFFRGEDIADVLYLIITEAVRRTPSRRYRAIKSYFMQVSNLKQLIRGSNQKALISGLFDHLHRDSLVNDEPLFWLQYSIWMMDLNELSASETFLSTAYTRAESLSGFKTYQLDTHGLRILLLIEQSMGFAERVTRIEKILSTLDNMIVMVSETSHRSYALRALNELEPFVNTRALGLSDSESRALAANLERLVRTLEDLRRDNEHNQEVAETAASVERAQSALMKVVRP